MFARPLSDELNSSLSGPGAVPGTPRRWILIRHGETAWNRERRIQGQTDVPLNARGRRQARALARLLRGEQPDVIFVSDLRRARATARLAFPGVEAPVVVTRRLREEDHGTLEGLTVKEADAWTRIHQGGPLRRRDPARRWPGGESFRDLLRRVRPLLRLAAARAPGGTVAAVGHLGTVRALLILLRGLPPARFAGIDVRPGTAVRLTCAPPLRTLSGHARISRARYLRAAKAASLSASLTCW